MLLVNEVYRSILGESLAAGWPAVIVRLTGCHCRCTYCDTEHAFVAGEERSVAELCRQVEDFSCRRVLVTGGEPLLQPEVLHLLTDLLRNEKLVWLETSGVTGTVPLSRVPAGVRRVVDVKTPSSGIDSALIDWDEILSLNAADELKFVCGDRTDYEWVRDLLQAGERLPAETPLTISPVFGALTPDQLAEWSGPDASGGSESG